MPSEAAYSAEAAFGCEGRIGGGGLPQMRYVYLLQSKSSVDERYVGVTSDLKQRLADHNAGKSSHTSKYVPWKLVAYVAFSDERKAETFERYLKSGSGHAFARKRLW